MFLSKELVDRESSGTAHDDESDKEETMQISSSHTNRPQRTQNNRFQLKKTTETNPAPMRNLAPQLIKKQSPSQLRSQNPSFLDDLSQDQSQVIENKQNFKNEKELVIFEFDQENDDSKSEESPPKQLESRPSTSTTYQQRQRALEQQKQYLLDKQKQQFQSQGVVRNSNYINDQDLDFKRLSQIIDLSNHNQHEPGQFSYDIDNLPQLRSLENKGYEESKFNSSQLHPRPNVEEQKNDFIMSREVEQSDSNSEEENERESETVLMEQGKEDELRKEMKQVNEKIQIEQEEPEPQEPPEDPEDHSPLDMQQLNNRQDEVIVEPPQKKSPYPKPFDNIVITDMKHFLTSPSPQGGMVQCTIKRDHSGMGRFYPKYHIHLSNGYKFLMTAKKQACNNTSNYVISMNRSNLSKKGPDYLGKVRSNFMGTEFNLFDKGINPIKVKSASDIRCQLGMVFYESNILGTKGPRKMKILLPRVLVGSNELIAYKPKFNDQNSDLMADYRSNKRENMMVCINRPPKWNDQVNAFVLNFYGRVDKPSVKNFQLVEEGQEDIILLQFGRVGKELFNLDFQYPISPLQAFEIALSSFDYKIACE